MSTTNYLRYAFEMQKRRYNSAEIALVIPILVGAAIMLIFSLITLMIP